MTTKLREEHPLTYRELLALLGRLTEEQLDTKVYLLTETSRLPIEDFWVVPEDHINPSGDGLEPVSVYVDNLELLVSEPVIVPKGSVFLLAS